MLAALDVRKYPVNLTSNSRRTDSVRQLLLRMTTVAGFRKTPTHIIRTNPVRDGNVVPVKGRIAPARQQTSVRQ